MNAPTNGNGQIQQAAPTKAIQRSDPRQQKVINLRDYLEVRKKSLADVLPRHMTPDRVIKVALAAFSKTPKLQECTIESVAQSIMQAAELGLEPGGALGHAYLVPYGNTCTLIPGYRGLIRLARQSGEIDSIETHPVHANDKFTLKFGLNPILEHEPCLDGDPGELRFVYAIARLKDGGHQLEVMTKAQVDKIRSGSKGGNSQAWKDSFDEMARKTVVRRLCKYLPLSPEKSDTLAKALEIDDEPSIDVVAVRDAEVKAETRSDQVLRKAKKGAAVEPPLDVESEPADVSAPPTQNPDEPPPGVSLPTLADQPAPKSVIEAKSESGRTVRIIEE